MTISPAAPKLETTRRQLVGKLLQDPDVPSLILLLLAVQELGWDAVAGEDALDPLVVYHELEQKFMCILPEENQNKLQAWITFLESPDKFYNSVDVFNAVCVGMCEGDLNFDEDGKPERPEWPEVAWTFWQINFFFDKPDDLNSFSKKVKRNIANIIFELGEGNEANPMQPVIEYINEQKEQLAECLSHLGVSPEEIKRAFDKAEEDGATLS